VGSGRAREVDGEGAQPRRNTREVTSLEVEVKATPRSVGRLGDYHLLRKIGQGGMGEIFLAKRIRAGGFEKTFAIKRMLDSLAGSPEFVSMFFDEARLAAQLTHPNIAQIYDFGVADGHHYIAMEHIAGEDLNTVIARLRDERLDAPVGIALRIAFDVCTGLEYAHTLTEDGRPLHIIHRDVSPANIMISYQGVVKLLDFGIAKATSRVSETRTGSLKGKLSFVAPEQIRGLPADPRADLFSFGIGLYGLLTHRHPFRRETELATMHAITQCDPPDPRRYRPDLPEEVVEIIRKALARERQDRYASAGEMASVLKGALARHAPATGSHELAEWLTGLFGPLRMQEKSRVPTVSRIDIAGPATQSTASGDLPSTSGAVAPVAAPTIAPARSWWRMPVSLALAVAVSAAVLSLTGADPRRASAPAASIVAPAAPIAAPAAVPLSAPEPTTVAPAPPAAPPRAATLARAAVTRERPPGPLDLPTLQAVVKRSHHRFTSCFRSYSADLPGASGQVRIELAVAASGKVSSATATLPGFTSAPLSRCLEQEARRLRFPRHPEQEVRFALPLAYRRGD
jgi:serine/threonine protein kinase